MDFRGFPYYGKRFQELDEEQHRLTLLRDLYYDRYTFDSRAGRESAHDWMKLADETNSKLIAISEMKEEERIKFEKGRVL